MGEETAFENCGISDFQELMTLTLDLIVLLRRPLPTYIPIFIEIKETFCGWMDVRADILHPIYEVDSEEST